MQRVVRDVGEQPHIKILAIGGDLRVLRPGGRAASRPSRLRRENLTIAATANGIEISCHSGCLLFVPNGAMIEAGDIGGDGRLTDLDGEVLIRTIGGDCSLRRLGKTSMERVGGDAQIRRGFTVL